MLLLLKPIALITVTLLITITILFIPSNPYQYTRKPEKMSRNFILWLHGLGDSGPANEPIKTLFTSPQFKNSKWSFPSAPSNPVTCNYGHVMPSWFDIHEIPVTAPEKNLIAAIAMKKLYRKSTVHPSPPSTSDHLSFLPAAILTLAISLSPEEKEVLAYLISFGNHHHNHRNIGGSGGGGSGRRSTNHHPVSLTCYCFGCYMSYWMKWDSSPNRQLIHEIIDAYEDAPSPAAASGKKERSKKVRRKNKKNPAGSSPPVKMEEAVASSDLGLPPPVKDTPEVVEIPADADEGGSVTVEEEEMGKGPSSVRKILGFVGEKIWGIWS